MEVLQEPATIANHFMVNISDIKGWAHHFRHSAHRKTILTRGRGSRISSYPTLLCRWRGKARQGHLAGFLDGAHQDEERAIPLLLVGSEASGDTCIFYASDRDLVNRPCIEELDGWNSWGECGGHDLP